MVKAGSRARVRMRSRAVWGVQAGLEAAVRVRVRGPGVVLYGCSAPAPPARPGRALSLSERDPKPAKRMALQSDTLS